MDKTWFVELSMFSPILSSMVYSVNMAFSNGVAGSIFGPITSFFAVYACICYENEEYEM